MHSLPILLTALVALPVLADPAAPPAEAKPTNRGKPYLQASAGWMEAEENRLGSADGLAVSVGFGYGLRQRLALEFELDLWQLDYPVPADTPPIFLGSIDNLDVRALSGVFLVKGRFPFGRFRPYLAAGPGITFAKAELTGNLIGLPGTFADESDTAILLEALAGFDVRLTQRSRMGLEYRWVDADASFGDISDGSVAIGGQSVRLTYSHQFD